MFMAELSTPSVCLGKILIQVSVLAQAQSPVCLRSPALSVFPCFIHWRICFPLTPSMHLVHARWLPLSSPHTELHCHSRPSLIGNTDIVGAAMSVCVSVGVCTCNM